MTRFVLLRDRSGNWRRSTAALTMPIAPQDPDQPGDPMLETLDLDPDALRDLLEQPDALLVAPAMPTQMTRPEPLDALREADVAPGWGISAVQGGIAQIDGARRDGSGVHMALLGTGVEADHPAFAGVRIVAQDFTGTGGTDVHGHGTHLAGTMLGRDHLGTRIGLARGCGDLMTGKVLADTGRGWSDDFLRAVLWALEGGADIIGFALSFDAAGHLEMLQARGWPLALATQSAVQAYRGNLRLVETALRMRGPEHLPLLLAAVGNDSMRMVAPEFETGPATPAAANGVLSVGALLPGEDGLAAAPFSNAGPALTAPGLPESKTLQR